MKRACYVLLLGLAMLGIRAPQIWALTIEEYCQMSLEILHASVAEMNERIAAANQYAKSPPDYFAALQALETEQANRREELYSKYGSSKTEYLTFRRRHYLAVESYLEHHDEVRHEIEEVTRDAAGRREQLESAIVNAGLHRALPPKVRPKRYGKE